MAARLRAVGNGESRNQCFLFRAASIIDEVPCSSKVTVARLRVTLFVFRDDVEYRQIRKSRSGRAKIGHTRIT